MGLQEGYYGSPQEHRGSGGGGWFPQQRPWPQEASSSGTYLVREHERSGSVRHQQRSGSLACPQQGQPWSCPGYGHPSQPQSLPAAPPQCPEGRRPRRDSWPINSDRQTGIAVLLIFVGLFCGIGAWWLHSAHDRSSASAAPSPALVAGYTQAITTMTQYCTQDAVQLENMLAATHNIEVKAGVTDESLTQLAGNLASVVAANSRPVSCGQEFAAYATLRSADS
jgi:hypothetical protein